MQAVALFWIGFTFTENSTLAQMIMPLAAMGAGVGMSLPACNTAGMSAVDAERAGMGSGLMQMTFRFIPPALGVAVVTSIIGTLAAASRVRGVVEDQFEQQAVDYVAAVQAERIRQPPTKSWRVCPRRRHRYFRTRPSRPRPRVSTPA